MKNRKYTIFVIMLLLILSMIQVSFKDKGSNYYEQVTPIVKSMQDSNYLKNDFYVQENQGFNVRMFFAMLVYNVNIIFNDLNVSFAFVYVFIYFMLSYTIYLFCLKLTKDSVFSLLAVIFLHAVTYIQLGALNLFGVRPNTLGYALIFLSLYHLLQRNYKSGFFILGAVVPYQIILGLITYCTFMFCFIYENIIRFNIKIIIKKIVKSLTFFIIAFPVLFMFIKTNIKTSLPQYSSQFGYIFSHFMHDSHSAPFTWTLGKYVVFILFITTVLCTLKKIGYKDYRWYRYVLRYRVPYAICLLVFITIGVIFVELIPIGIIAKAQMFRCLVLFSAFGYLIIFRYIYNRIQSFNIDSIKLMYCIILCLFFYASTVPVALLLILFDIYFVDIFYSVKNALRKYNPIVFTSLLVFMIYNIIGLFINVSHIHNDPFQVYRVLFNIVFFIIVMFTINKEYTKYLLICGLLVVLLLTNIYNYDACTEIKDVTDYIKMNTAKNDILLIPPYELRFRLCSNRAVVVDGQPLYTDTSAWKWKQRMEDVIGHSILDITNNNANELYHKLNHNKINDIAVKYNASYFVKSVKFKPWVYPDGLVYHDNTYAVYEVKK